MNNKRFDVGTLHKAINKHIHKYKVIYKYSFNKRLDVLEDIANVKRDTTLSDENRRDILYILNHLLYNHKRTLTFYGRKLRDAKRLISKIHHNYNKKGYKGISKYIYVIENKNI